MNKIIYQKATMEDNRIKIGPKLPKDQQQKINDVTELVKKLKNDLRVAEDDLWNLQKQCPHNNIRYFMFDSEYICSDCGSDVPTVIPE